MPIVTLKMTEEEEHLLHRLMEVTFSRSRSEVLRDALMDAAERRDDLVHETADARHARRYYLPRQSRYVRRADGTRGGHQT